MNDYEHQQMMEERAQASLDALKECLAAGVSQDALMTLAYEAGVATEFYREIRK